MANPEMSFFKTAPGEGQFTDRKFEIRPPESLYIVLRSVVNTFALNNPESRTYNPDGFAIISTPTWRSGYLELQAWHDLESDGKLSGRVGLFRSSIDIGLTDKEEPALIDEENRIFPLAAKSFAYLRIISSIPGDHLLSW